MSKPKEYSSMTKNKLMTYTFFALLILTVITAALWSTEKTPSGWNLGLTLGLNAVIAVGLAVGIDAFLSKIAADSPLNTMSAAVFGLIVTGSYSLGVPAMNTVELFPLRSTSMFRLYCTNHYHRPSYFQKDRRYFWQKIRESCSSCKTHRYDTIPQHITNRS